MTQYPSTIAHTFPCCHCLMQTTLQYDARRVSGPSDAPSEVLPVGWTYTPGEGYRCVRCTAEREAADRAAASFSSGR